LKEFVGSRCKLLDTTAGNFVVKKKMIYRVSGNDQELSWNTRVHDFHVKETDIGGSKGWVYFVPPEGQDHDDGGAEIERITSIDQNYEESDDEIRVVEPVHEYRGGDIHGIDQTAGIAEPDPVWVQIEYAPIENELDTSESTYAVGTVGSKKVFFYSGLDGGLSVRYKDSRVMYPHINGFEPLN
jgi:hypothetical protein